MPADVALNAAEHNYLKLLAAYVPADLLKPGVYVEHIEHDDWCKIYKLGTCNCKPNITIETAITHIIVFKLRWRNK